MRIVVAGEWRWPWYQEAFADALRSLGHDVHGFGWAELFYEGLGGEREPRFRSASARLQNRLLWGPLLFDLNRRLAASAGELRPDLLLLYSAQAISPRTLRKVRRISPRTLVAQYSNDSPFGAGADPLLWRHVRRSIPLCDLHFVYRPADAEPMRRLSGKDVHLLAPYFVPGQDFHETPGPGEERFSCDVVFAGHYADDGRLEALEAIAATGVRLNLFGGGWERARERLSPASPLLPLFPVRPAIGRHYRLAISGAKIALCFLSRRNRDTYTRRCFEVPAMETFLLSEHSPDLATLFTEGEEIELFRSREEMLTKVSYYLEHGDERRRIARAGRRRVERDGHDVVSRARELLRTVSAARGVPRSSA